MSPARLRLFCVALLTAVPLCAGTDPVTPVPSPKAMVTVQRPVIPLPAPAAPSFQSAKDFLAGQAAHEPILAKAEIRAEELATSGDYEGSIKQITKAFPPATRTADECFLIANALFPIDPATSYALHKEAAERAPDAGNALYEWAIEQHRRKEYAGALATYERVSRMAPSLAIPYGLAAECALRQGDTDRAVELWQRSEAAPEGTIEGFEELVCEINGGFLPSLKRRALYKDVLAGDEQAAASLLLLDSAWKVSWWSDGPNQPYLAHDLPLIESRFTRRGEGLEAALCVAHCAQIQTDNVSDQRVQRMAADGFLLPPRSRLPADGRALSLLLGYALQTQDLDSARNALGPQVIAMAEQSTDAELYNAAARLYVGRRELTEIDQHGWQATRDPRFAGSLLLSLQSSNRLPWGSPLLNQALEEFPEDSVVERVAMRAAMKAGQPPRALIIQAIEAEYSEFSPQSGLAKPRRGAAQLREYFAILEKAPR